MKVSSCINLVRVHFGIDLDAVDAVKGRECELFIGYIRENIR